ncbi:hypothetical protein L0B53_04345 [Vibrio sp. SS-MA-C1-2]|uniref:hypothetical protein n=1 Tax=Vibrio sp. SS-MA-C1-2 TaxID=2908646 RepID=UPI001F3DD76F|nr:hypothetical protein [Vibrio sp. SS-MA-C1-2]UJF17153.1 hypothetical protein L0B53_04345 [Vibrio sp. SS-MA-C1-2]
MMSYQLITTPEFILDHEIALIEADIDNVPQLELNIIVPTGQSYERMVAQLKRGDYLLLCDQPSIPLFLKAPFKESSSEFSHGMHRKQNWLLNPKADPQLAFNLGHISYKRKSDETALNKTVSQENIGSYFHIADSSAYGATEPSIPQDKKPLPLAERLKKQRREQDNHKTNQVQARFHYRSSQGKIMEYGNWTGERIYVPDVSWRLLQNNVEIAAGTSDQSGSLLVQDLSPEGSYLLEYCLPPRSGFTTENVKQQRIKINDYRHIVLDSLVLTHYYDDLENTPVHQTPYRVTLENGDTYEGTTNADGTLVIGPLPAAAKEIEFYPHDSEEEIHAILRELNQFLDETITQYARAAADEIKANYAPIHTDQDEEENKVSQVTADFKEAIEEEINKLKQQSFEFDAQAWYEQLWDVTLAAGGGMADGITNYLPDLGAFGELLDKMQLDLEPQIFIKALVNGDVDELERVFQQWQARASEGYEEASAQMEIIIILLKDPQTRETLLSLPQRFLEEAPTDALVELAAAQTTQTGTDFAVVATAGALGTMIIGPGGIITTMTASAGTTVYKVSSVAEQMADTLMSLSSVRDDLKQIIKEET